MEKLLNSKKKQAKAYAKYSGMGIQMGLTIFLGGWSGQYLDNYYNTETPWFTAGFSLVATFLAIYFVIKGIDKLTKK